MNEHDEFEAWKAEVYEALRDNVPEFVGAESGGDGQFKNVGFHIGAAYDADGERGDMIVRITITDQDSPRKGKHTQIEGNWREDVAEQVATKAIAAYIRLTTT
jgi:hypothetical protein